MRVLHFSDLHIGVENYGRIDPETGLSTRLGDFLAAFDQVVDYAIDNHVDLVLLAGDAYKGRDPSQTHQREFARRLTRLSTAGIPSFLLVGNHDLPNAASRATAVEIFSTLEVPNVYIGASLQIYIIRTPSGPVQILAVPWPRRSTLISREESRGLSIEEVRQSIERRMTEGIESRAGQLDPSLPTILTGHVTVNGATLGTERSMMLGQDHILPASAFDRPNIDYVALGHIHRHQVLRADRPMLVYSGSLQRVDFSEEGDDKGFCVVELDPSAPTGQRMVDFRFQPLEARSFVTVDVTVEPGHGDPTEAVLQAIARKSIDDSVVRVRVTLPAEMEPHLRESEIRRALDSAHYVAAISKEVQGGRRTRLAADAARGLRPAEAVRMYLESREMPPERREKLLQYAQELIESEDAANL